LKDIIQNYENLDKMTKKNNKKSREKRPNWNHYYHWKNKNHKLVLKDNIEKHKNFDKKEKEKK
jgi:hypothetical protein